MAHERSEARRKATRGAREHKDDPNPGAPKTAHREYADGGKNANKDTREELRDKH